MCGILGAFKPLGPEATDDRTLGAMRERLAHRGPDGNGVFTDGACGLSHRRLSIIDLSDAGSQPMRGPCGESMVYNG